MEHGHSPARFQPQPHPLGLAGLLFGDSLPVLATHDDHAGAAAGGAAWQPAVPSCAGGATLLKLPREAGTGLPGRWAPPQRTPWSAAGLVAGVGAGASLVGEWRAPG